MTIFETIILAVVEGVTEFLPVSSTGHVLIVSELMGITSSEFLTSFTIAIQLGAMLAVVGLYARRLVQDFDIWKKLTIAFIPTAVIGVAFFSFIKGTLLENQLVIVVSIIVGGFAMIAVEQWLKNREVKAGDVVTVKQAFIIGLAQAVAFIPGVSRSAATIIGGLLLRLPRKTVVEFSFLLALPTMAAATGYDLLQTGARFARTDWIILIFGMIISFFVALLVIKWLLRFIERYTFIPFGIYRIIIGCILLLVLLI